MYYSKMYHSPRNECAECEHFEECFLTAIALALAVNFYLLSVCRKKLALLVIVGVGQNELIGVAR